jgi:hypothetical protein
MRERDDVQKWGKRILVHFHPDKVHFRFKLEDKPILSKFTQTILRITKETLDDSNWTAVRTGILRQVNHVRQFASIYEDWSMQCDLLYSFHQEELSIKLDEDLVKMGYGCYKGCATLEDFTAIYLSRLE